MIPGQYFHAGLKKGIISSLESLQIDPSSLNKVRVIFNIDGSSFSASSRSKMHFCEGMLADYEAKPFEIGVYHGWSKPSYFNAFLRRFTEEANDLITNGIMYNGKILSFELFGFSCDWPAVHVRY